jgi:hypothetical protein
MKEALTLALDALEECRRDPRLKYEHPAYDKTITAIKEALAQPEQDNTYGYASRLATAIWQKHYMKDAPKWKPLNTTEGVLTQIDNMTCGLVKEKQAQPEQEPVGKLQEATVERAWFTIDELNAWADKKLSENPHWVMPKDEPERDEPPQQRTWVGLTDEELAEFSDAKLGSYDLCLEVEAKLKEKNT